MMKFGGIPRIPSRSGDEPVWEKEHTMKRNRKWLADRGVALALVVSLAVAAGGFLVACTAKPSTRTVSGTMTLFLQAMKMRDVAKMQSYCKDTAVADCEKLMAAVEEMEKTGKASRFDSWQLTADSGADRPRTSTITDLFGVNRDLFARATYNLERQPNNEWRIYQMTWESRQ